ncbi:3-oxoacid CoA-transferase subunit A [Endozoicomonas sp. Mp262]|uniref:3-oxoacid CoA-transferase subunit A n=1 Tax=Endozoicomonas sp. Mp262 TaxID=2919499 RepID=UPI0021D9F4A1
MSSKPVLDASQVLEHLEDGMTIMVGGFMNAGAPLSIIEAIADSSLRNLTYIGNDTGLTNEGVGRLVSSGVLSKVITTHIGLNKDTGRLMHEGKLDVELVPQGTLVERIRAGGAGLGGVLTPTGIGTIVENGKQVITVNGQDFLLELPLRADISLIHASRVDRCGNAIYRGSSRNFNPLMATSADKVFVEAEEVVEMGELDPDHIVTPRIFVNYIVKSQPVKRVA